VFLTDGAACWCYLRIDYGFTNVKVMDGGCIRLKKELPEYGK